MADEEQYLPDELPQMAGYGMQPGRLSRGYSRDSYDAAQQDAVDWVPKTYLEKGLLLQK